MTCKPQTTEPSRRRWLKKLGLLGGAAAVSGGCPFQSQASTAEQDPCVPQDQRYGLEPFYGPHQAGIITPQQASMMLLAFDVLAENTADLQRMFRLLTERIAFLTTGGPAPAQENPLLPPMDSGILGADILPDNLTITVSVGASLFDSRYGLQARKPRKLQIMTRFPNDSLDAAYCHGDLLLQICANGRDTVIHAARDIIKYMPDLLAVRWRYEGFISAHAAASRGKETPVNLLGFKDGTANPQTSDPELIERVLWVAPASGESEWATGGSYQAVRLIRFHVEMWDRTPLHEQETIFGRNKTNGAPLGMQHEHDVPDYSQDPQGQIIPLDAHMRLANPRDAGSEQRLLLRRGYSYSGEVLASGQLDMGLLFVCYQRDLEKSFISVQQRLNGEPLEEYIRPFGGGYFFALPGVADNQHYLAQSLLEN